MAVTASPLEQRCGDARPHPLAGAVGYDGLAAKESPAKTSNRLANPWRRVDTKKTSQAVPNLKGFVKMMIRTTVSYDFHSTLESSLRENTA